MEIEGKWSQSGSNEYKTCTRERIHRPDRAGLGAKGRQAQTEVGKGQGGSPAPNSKRSQIKKKRKNLKKGLTLVAVRKTGKMRRCGKGEREKKGGKRDS